jgi:hypothetical protein
MLHLGFFFLVRTLSQCENLTFDQSPSPLHLLQDFVGSDRALLADELAGKYSGLVQFPLFGQALVLTYNVDGLSASDPEYLVRRMPSKPSSGLIANFPQERRARRGAVCRVMMMTMCVCVCACGHVYV